MRSPRYKQDSLADLQRLVLPPLTTSQFAVADETNSQQKVTEKARTGAKIPNFGKRIAERGGDYGQPHADGTRK